MSLSTSFNLERSETAVVEESLQRFDNKWPRRSVAIEAGYPSDDYLVDTNLWFSSFDPDDDEDFVLVQIEWERGLPRPKKLTRQLQKLIDRVRDIDAILLALKPFIDLTDSRCQSHYQLDLEEWTPCVSLPLLQIKVPGTSLERISGVRLTSSNPSTYESATLDLLDGSRFGVSLAFRAKGTLSEELFDTVSLHSRRIRDCLVKPRHKYGMDTKDANTSSE